MHSVGASCSPANAALHALTVAGRAPPDRKVLLRHSQFNVHIQWRDTTSDTRAVPSAGLCGPARLGRCCTATLLAHPRDCLNVNTATCQAAFRTAALKQSLPLHTFISQRYCVLRLVAYRCARLRAQEGRRAAAGTAGFPLILCDAHVAAARPRACLHRSAAVMKS